jgi:acyl carrier protein
MTPQQHRLLDLARHRFGERAHALTVEADFFDALQIDSLQAMELLTDIEDTFGVELPDWELQGVRTLAALADLVTRYGG